MSWMHKYETVKVSLPVVSDSLWPHGLQSARLLCPWNSLSKNTGWSGQSLPSLGDLSNPGIKPGSPPLQADSNKSNNVESTPLTSCVTLSKLSNFSKPQFYYLKNVKNNNN